MKEITKIICVDFQKDFTSPEGNWFNPGKSVNFIKDTFIPFIRENHITIFEIISDYRQPRPGDVRDGCRPGMQGYESDIPVDIKSNDIWIKCMNSPIWIRENIGDPDGQPGIPYQDPEKFTKWLDRTIGRPNDLDFVTLVGLTVDRCVFSVAQELSWRGYSVKILDEGTDAVYGDEDYKRQLFTKSPLLYWASVIIRRRLKDNITR